MLFLLLIVGYTNGVLIETPLGKIEGSTDQTINGRTIFSFEGLPYAEPPIGENRFKFPVPVKRWVGIWKADQPHICLQYNAYPYTKVDVVQGQEDCLYMNIYTPKIEAKFPVMVFIHGGGFIFGSGNAYRPNILLDHNVILVTINYRLGPLGFLSTEDDIVPGNNGIRDQSLALKWISENIAYFGGDRHRITISGLSAGGASVHLHMLSPHTRGLFRSAISMSGCTLNPWAIMENPLATTKQLAAYVGCESNDNRKMVACLKNRSARQIVEKVGKFQPWMFNPFSPFGLVIDGHWSENAVLSAHPLELMKDGKVADVPWILSHVSGEGLFNAYDYYDQEKLEYIDEHWDEVIPHILHYNFTIQPFEQDQVSQKIRIEYFGDQHLRKQNFGKLVDVLGDRLFKVGLDDCARLQSAAMKSNVWYYVFNYRGAHSLTEARGGTSAHIGVAHGDDTSYIFKRVFDPLTTKEDAEMSRILTEMFVSFLHEGIPKVNQTWNPLQKNSETVSDYLEIDSPTSLHARKDGEFGRKLFWSSIKFRENEYLLQINNEL